MITKRLYGVFCCDQKSRKPFSAKISVLKSMTNDLIFNLCVTTTSDFFYRRIKWIRWEPHY